MVDRFYTPPKVAERLLAALPTPTGPIADFAAGAGSLLNAASHRWSGANLIATDSDALAVRRLRTDYPDWRTGVCDFLNARSRARSRVISEATEGVSLVVLNPPYSFRGGTSFEIGYGDRSVSCSKAAAFVGLAASFLTSGGRIAAVLPASSPYSEKDRLLYQILRTSGEITLGESLDSSTFSECRSTSVFFYYVKHRTSPTIAPSADPLISDGILQCVITRGVVSPAEPPVADGPRRRFLHTTDIGTGRPQVHLRNVRDSKRRARAHAILLPRVGRATKNHVCLYSMATSSIISDCIFALQFQNATSAKRALRLIRSHWEIVAEAYRGTGAPYITILRLMETLQQVGISVRLPAGA